MRIKRNYFLDGNSIKKHNLPKNTFEIGRVNGYYTSCQGNLINYRQYFYSTTPLEKGE